MSDPIQHECGVAFIRFRKPFSYYVKKYGSLRYCIERFYLLMHKQHNRGQDGAGIAMLKTDLPPGRPYLYHSVSIETQAIEAIFGPFFTNPYLSPQAENASNLDEDQDKIAENIPFLGNLMLGHLRYGTYGNNQKASCHPVIRHNNWRVRNIALAGNFNMTNNDELFELLLSLGQHPISHGDTPMVLEKIGHFLDEEVQRLYTRHKRLANGQDVRVCIENGLDVRSVLRHACKSFDGGYVLAGLLGHGAAFVARDRVGIRPAYYYANEEVVVVASERPPIKAAFDVLYDDIKSIPPAHALIVQPDGSYVVAPYIRAGTPRNCIFERIYFSRASDPIIYQERKQLGRLLAPYLRPLLGSDLKKIVFSYVPNTSEVAFYGLIEALMEGTPKHAPSWPHIEQLITKDVKFRTFITNDKDRKSLVSKVYDTAYQLREGEKTLVVAEDSIVRGTTLRNSILTLLATLGAEEIIIVSAAPQVRYPDCYGIDMSRLQDFIAFQAVMSLLKQRNQSDLLEKVRLECENALQKKDNAPNYVQQIYEPFSEQEISQEIANILSPKGFKPNLKVVYLSSQDLKKIWPSQRGDWCFTGNYPTAGGNRTANKSFLQAMNGSKARAY